MLGFYLNLKINSKINRIQFQRKIRNLESTLDDAQLEISSLLKQKKAAWQRNSQSVSMNGSLLDLAQK